MPNSLSTLDEVLTREVASGAFFADPYPTYRILRESDPVHWFAPWEQWLVTSHEEVKAVLQHPEVFSSSGWEQRFLGHLTQDQRAELPNVAYHYATPAINNSDPPAHTRFRRLVSKSFTPKVLADVRPQVELLVRAHLEALKGQPGFDLMASLAYPVPALVIGRLFGAPDEAGPGFQAWSQAIVAFVSTGYPEFGRARQADESLREFREFLEPLLADRRRQPRDDLMSLLAAPADGQELSDRELVAACVVLLFAGHETTANLIGNGIYALLRSPDQLQLLREQPALAGAAVEEMLRFDAPVQRVRRVALCDFELGGCEIAAGQLVMAFLGAANRDPARVADPDRFDIERNDGAHLSFGHGIHFCVGAALSRIEAPIAVSELLGAFPAVALDRGRLPVWKRNITFRGFESLPLVTTG